MLQGIKQELKERKKEAKSSIKSVYFGGGTPSLLTQDEIIQLIGAIKNNYTLSKDAELTLEANPENITKENLVGWSNAGFNRLSIGLQSFKESDLEWMNRGHSATEALKSVSLAGANGFTNVSVDLMYGLPGLNDKEWVSHLKKVVACDVAHVSAYCLTVEKGTRLAREVKKGRRVMPEDDIIEKQYNTLVSFLKKEGFEQYEVSNFAKNKQYSKHNSSYWKGVNYIGVGPSAHSFLPGKRRWNIANNLAYIKQQKEGLPFYEEEVLGKKEMWNELFLIGLRTGWGVNESRINELGGFNEQEKATLVEHIKRGHLKHKNGCFTLTRSGFLFADAIAEDFFRVS